VTERFISVLGEGGLFISTGDLLPVGSRLLLEFVDQSRKSLEVIKCEVVWVKKSSQQAGRGMGVKFVDMTYENKRVVYGLVDDILYQHQESLA
jgi:Tfp pilus assembly protein PilZ